MKLSLFACVDTTDPEELRSLAAKYEAAAKRLREAAAGLDGLKKSGLYHVLINHEHPKGRILPAYGLGGAVFPRSKKRLSVRKAAYGYLHSQPTKIASATDIFVAVRQMGATISTPAGLSAVLSRDRKTFKSVERGVWGLVEKVNVVEDFDDEPPTGRSASAATKT